MSSRSNLRPSNPHYLRVNQWDVDVIVAEKALTRPLEQIQLIPQNPRRSIVLQQLLVSVDTTITLRFV